MSMVMFMFLIHGIVVLSTCYNDMHGMSLYDVVLPFMYKVGLTDYIEDLSWHV